MVSISEKLKEIKNMTIVGKEFGCVVQPLVHLLVIQKGIKNGSKGARTLDLPLVRRALIPAELCFHKHIISYSRAEGKKNQQTVSNQQGG